MGHIVGIDLGTTNSLCAIFQAGTPRLIRNAHGRYLTPSVVGILDDGQVLVGDSAKELRVTQPERCTSRFKRYMGSGQNLTLGDQSFTPIQLSSMVLKSLKQDVESELQDVVDEAVITVPAYFNDMQRRATKLAGEMAGFQVRRIINEPTAAALTYGFHDRDAKKYLLVVDLGGGTFDVTLMEIYEGTLEIVATAGESMLGGEDFTDRLVTAVLQRQKLNLEVAEVRQPLLVARLRQVCEKAKVEISERPTVEIALPETAGYLDATKPTFSLDQASFAQLMEPLLHRLTGPIHRVLRDGGKHPKEIDEMILVGGATRMPCLRQYLEEQIGIVPRVEYNPDEVVALGAAVQAALINDDESVEDLVMTDVAPHTLGIEIIKQFGNQINEGFFSPIIHRNTTVPVSKEEIYSTVEMNQTEVRLKVFQGESRKVKDNLLLGELVVKDIPLGPPGTPIAVRFTFDVNGILEVEAVVPSTGKKQKTVLTSSNKDLTPDEIEAAIERLRSIKFYPRDEIENQRLLRYCERLIGEVSPLDRPELEKAVDAFEIALNSGDPEFFHEVRQTLLLFLSQLGYGFDDESGDVA